MRKLFCLLLFCVTVSAQETPQQLERELLSAEAQYERAKQMFNPWYTGPLVTPASSMMPPGSADIQPYLFLGGTYGTYNKDRQSVSLPHNIYSLQVTSVMLVGVTPSIDVSIAPSGQVSWQNHKNGGGFNDFTATLGFCVNAQTLYVPGMKFTIAETFPTGKYKNLSTNGLGLNATGGGSYQTQFGFAIGKIIWWIYRHPLHLRYFVGYTLPTSVHVTGFNAYGGGFHTRGVVHPGKTFSSDLGMEWSFTERWVLAMDVVYVAQNKTKFHGERGVLASGASAVVGSGYNDNLSLAPALEYNWNANLGIVWGVQFSVYGRNSPHFAKGQFSVTYTW